MQTTVEIGPSNDSHRRIAGRFYLDSGLHNLIMLIKKGHKNERNFDHHMNNIINCEHL